MAYSDDLLAHYDCGEASGNLLDVHGSTDLADVNGVGSATGKIGNGRDIENGSTQCFESTATFLNNLPLSILLWFKAESFISGGATLIGAGVNAQHNYAWGLTTGGTGDDKLCFYASDGSASFHTIAGTTSLSTGVWYHAALVWRSATDYEVFLNGASEVTGNTSRVPGDWQQNQFRVGTYGGGTAPAAGFDGVIDEISLFERDVTADLAWFYNSGNGRTYAEIIGGSSAAAKPLGCLLTSPGIINGALVL